MFLQDFEKRALTKPALTEVVNGLRRRPNSSTSPAAAPKTGLTAKVIELARFRATPAPTALPCLPDGSHRRVRVTAAVMNRTDSYPDQQPIQATPGLGADREAAADRSDALGQQPYRLLVVTESRPAARQVLTLLWQTFATVGPDPLRISLHTGRPLDQPISGRPCRGPARITVDLHCDRTRRRHIVRFIQQAGELPGVCRVLWQSLPPTAADPPAC
ncbi:MAG: hypothetical protein EA400_02590 [Chromatiaceae bacterium]|nr:MAG: hypothetical protein EA400_02590 [Chromatiaceae bacterium]